MEGMQKEPHRNVYKYLEFCSLRRQGVSDEKIANRHGFKHPETLYHELRRDGFPVCERCGDYSPAGEHCKKRQARGSGKQRKELPATADAQRLFWPLVEEVHQAVDSLYWRQEYLQDGRFVAEDRSEGPILDQEGKLLIEKGALTQAGGGSWYPPEPLPTLIALYLLSDKPLEPLVEALDHDPTDAAWDALEKHIHGKDGLIRQAKQVGALVRGSRRTSQGRHSESVDAEDHDAAMFIQQKRRESPGRGDSSCVA